MNMQINGLIKFDGFGLRQRQKNIKSQHVSCILNAKRGNIKNRRK